MHRFFVEPCQVGEKEIRIQGSDVNHIKNVLRMSQRRDTYQQRRKYGIYLLY